MKILELELTLFRTKSIDLEEENMQLKKQVSELKKEKHMIQLEQNKVIRDSVRQIMQQNQKGIAKSNIFMKG